MWRILVSVLLFCLTANAFAARIGDEYHCGFWQLEAGLPQDQVRSVVQTADGYIWVATHEGLVRFDGMRFVTFNRENTAVIENSLFRVLYEDRQGVLWGGTEGGLIRYEGGRFTNYTTRDGLIGNEVRTIVEDRDGQLWIGTASGISRLRNNKFVNYTTKDGLAENEVWSMCRSHDGGLWIATNGSG